MEQFAREYDEITGLTSIEVKERINNGQVNKIPEVPSRTIWEILRANLFNKFNVLNTVLALMVIIAGAPKEAIFAVVIFTNTILGVFQEVKAKKTLEKLALLNKLHANVLRDKKVINIDINDVVMDDVILLNPGDQVVADTIVMSGSEFEVDESMLTGESDAICKLPGDKVYSGSFIKSGSGYTKVVEIGENTYIAKLSKEAKKFKVIHSQLQEAIDKILKILIWLIIPIGILLVTTQLISNDKSWQESIISATAGIVGMIPEGLVLLTTLTFVAGVVRLSKWNTLVQELPATEVLARVDTLCLDKTGTITEGDLRLVDVINLCNKEDEEIHEELAAVVNSLPNTNATQKAILDKYDKNPKWNIINNIAFSSSRKWCGIEFESHGVYIMGAPEMILKSNYESIKDKVELQASQGKRVLLLANFKGENFDVDLNGIVEPEALIILEDVIRKDAPETLEYFKQQGVQLKIISGDNPLTVSAVAKKAGVDGAEKYIDASEISSDDKEIEKVLEKNTVFGRVTPHQKRDFVKALQRKGHIVAMTGDGINDVLALKESDCGISMANGSDATKAVAQLVLLESNFNALPQVVSEGRRMINNLEMVSELFLTKAIYSVILSVIFSLLLLPYPFTPIQLSLVASISIGIPSFFLALGPNKERVKGDYLNRVLKAAISNGIVISVFITIIFISTYRISMSVESARSLSVIVLGGISLFILAKLAKPFNYLKLILICVTMGVFLATFFIPVSKSIFNLTLEGFGNVVFATLLIFTALPMISMVRESYSKIKKKIRDKKSKN